MQILKVPMMTGRMKHILHCILLFTVIAVTEISTWAFRLGNSRLQEFDPWDRYGYVGTFVLYLIRILTFLPLPQVLFNFAGLILYNTFPPKVKLKDSPLLPKFLCIRIVTRGDYPELVRLNVARNMTCCTESGLEDFLIEVVTDKAIGLTPHECVREVVVPPSYRPKSGALFKARALQYSLEDGVNILADTDWIVHLDEETLLTENSITGIINFVADGKHHFGQGLITYANEDIVNWITTFADCYRVADDMGKLRLQFSLFHKPLFSWKGSYVVAQVRAERQVSFDNGLDGSVAEDCYFAMKAYKKGYSFNFVEGEMWEKSTFSLRDFIQQRKRWSQGIQLVVHSKDIPLRYKFLLGISFYSWVTMPFSISNTVLAVLCPIPCPLLMDYVCAFIGAVTIYMYIFGVVKSFSLSRFGMLRVILCVCGAVCIIPFNILTENMAIIWGLFGRKHRFHVVNKENKQAIENYIALKSC